MKTTALNVLKIIAKPLTFLVYLGVQEPRKSFYNRITMFTNMLALWGLLCLVSLIPIMEKYNLGFEYYGMSYPLISVCCISLLILNGKNKHLAARIFGTVLINMAGWQAMTIFGKSFNGHYVFLVALIYPLMSLYEESKKLLWAASLFTTASMLINDYYFFHGVFPLTGLNSAEFSVAMISADTVLVVGFILTLLHLERSHSKKYEEELKSLNTDLENIVTQRTTMLLKAKEESFHSSILKAQFVANTSHELRTPMQGIVGFSELARMQLDKVKASATEDGQFKKIEKLEKYLGSLENSSERMGQLIERLLELTKTQSSKFSAQATRFNLKDVVDKVKTEHEHTARDGQIQISVETRASQLDCYSDQTLIEQVLGDLVENAVNYSHPGTGIQILIDSKGTELLVSVINQGVGVEPSEVDKIFEVFVQGTRTDNRTGGTGLGLSLCRKYAKAVQGHIELVNPDAENTTFVFRFPMNLDLEKTVSV